MTVPDEALLWSFLTSYVVPAVGVAGAMTIGGYLARRVVGRFVG